MVHPYVIGIFETHMHIDHSSMFNDEYAKSKAHRSALILVCGHSDDVPINSKLFKRDSDTTTIVENLGGQLNHLGRAGFRQQNPHQKALHMQSTIPA